MTQSNNLPDNSLDSEILRQIELHGVAPERIHEQLAQFQRGTKPLQLDRPCTIGDGIVKLDPTDFEELLKRHHDAIRQNRVSKFVPASGAASRMFHSLNVVYDRLQNGEQIAWTDSSDDPDVKAVQELLARLEDLPFYAELVALINQTNTTIAQLLANHNEKTLLGYILSQSGLNLANLPKGLIPFHRYDDHTRTPFAEQLAEAAALAGNASNVLRIHFTVPEDFQQEVQDHIEQIRSQLEHASLKFSIDYSIQSPSTDTIAVDLDNQPFRNSDGTLVFRPGGHGALLQNLNALQGDIVTIKNIDNVVPAPANALVFQWKRFLIGYCAMIQEALSHYLTALEQPDLPEAELNAALDFATTTLQLDVGEIDQSTTVAHKRQLMFNLLNRPLRICGMVKNEGEPGGGPFWVRASSGALSRQIVESSQIDKKNPEQLAIWNRSTHFNPVDLICAVRDFHGKPFDLAKFVDSETAFISEKSKDGKLLKALELPGLWNGAMAHWITLFVEVPIATFAPVKTVNDLLRPEHQGIGLKC